MILLNVFKRLRLNQKEIFREKKKLEAASKQPLDPTRFGFSEPWEGSCYFVCSSEPREMNFVPLFLPDVEQEYRNLKGGG